MQDKSSIHCAVRVVFLFTGLLFSVLSKAQQPYIPFHHYSSVDGLSQNQVLSILQDQQGFMWFGTLEGLNRFDGYEFIVYSHHGNDSTSLSNDFAGSIIEDREGIIWVGTGRGLNRYNRSTNSFSSYMPDPANKNSISVGLINQILEDELGNFWLAFATGYVDYFDRKQNTFTHYQIDKNLVDVSALQKDLNGNLWIGTQMGITIMNASHQIINRFQHHQNDLTSLSDNSVNDIFQDRDGSLWIATDEGLNKYDADHHNFIRFAHDNRNTNSISINTIKCLSQDKEGRLWIGTENGGLDIWDRVNNKFSHYQQHESDVWGINDNSIYSIFRDKHDNMWVGTNKSGVNFYDRFRKPFVIYQNIPDQKTSLSHNKVNAIAEQPGKGFWIATDGGGLNFFDESKGTFKAYRYQESDTQSVPSNFIVDVTWDAADECLWVATWGGGLARMNTESGRFKRYQHKENDLSSIASNNLWRLYQDREGLLYVGTVGNGLSIFDKATSTFYNYGPEQGLKEENVVSIFRDSKNFIWLGAWGNGVSRMDLAKKSFVSLPAGISISSNESIMGDSLDRVWISGYPGIQCYDVRKDSTFSLTTADGLPATNINGMLNDNRGNYWLGTNKGIVKYNLMQKQSIIFSVKDGLPANQFSARLLRTANGKMYFSSVNGLVVFHPDSIHPNPAIPNVVITDLRIFNKSVSVGGSDKILKQHISETKEIWLPFEYNFITLNFVGLNYTSTQGNQYAYRLDGFNEDWVLLDGQQRSATFTSLDPGDYLFHVKASNNDGLWNEKGVTLLIHVLPPWWSTYWFRMLVVIFVILSAISFYRYRVRSIALQNKKLSTLVTEKTKELQELNEEITNQNETLQERQEEIQSQNEELKQSQTEVLSQRDIMQEQNRKLEMAREIIEKQNEETKLRNENLELEIQARTKELLAYNQQLEQFAFISAHNLRAPVARIIGLGNVLELHQTKPDESKLMYQKMVSTARELDRVVRDLNTILEIRKNNTSVISELSFAEEFALVKIYTEKEIADTQSTITVNFSKAPTIRSVKPYLESILQNLLSNAIKYRHPNRTPVITLSTEPVEDYICLTVTDNGLGIDMELFKGKIFNLYQRFHNHVEGKGLGLYLIKTQILALGGRIELESRVDEGTTFKVYFRNLSQSRSMLLG